MRKPGGYAVIVSPGDAIANFDKLRCEGVSGGTTEYDTFSCGHCNRVTHVRPRMDPANLGGLCKQCMRLICAHCVDLAKCDPLEKKLERAEKREIALRSYGL